MAWSPLDLKRERNSVGDAAMRAGEGAVHAAQRAEAAAAGDGLHVLVGLEQSAAREIDAHPLDKIGRADVQAGAKQAAERAQRDAGLAASASVRQSARGCAVTFSASFADLAYCRTTARQAQRKTGSDRLGGCGRRRGAGRSQAQRSRPRSASIIASARSIPAVTPAEVQTPRSSTWMASPSTSTAGRNRFRASTSLQCVVARRPSSAPAAARKNVPLQTERCAARGRWRGARCR